MPGAFVWPCNRQPMWSDGHEIVNAPPEAVKVRFVGLVAGPELTVMVPFTARFETSQPNPGSNAGKTVELNELLRVVQSNRLNVSPSCSVAPMLLTTSVPP